ncbi:MAG: TetR/AcrR family transcriptional regulator [Candidatus Heteroscillospira sp.]|jgi:AcrR family transcriptional regulator
MNREEKNSLMYGRILDSALHEFSRNGYAAASINAICKRGGLSKGIVYHYFETKEALYLACADDCFQKLTRFLEQHIPPAELSAQQQLEAYFRARLSFFEENPHFQKLFCEVLMLPPESLAYELKSLRNDFDTFNAALLRRILTGVRLRPGLSAEEALLLITQLQDSINASRRAGVSISEHEEHTRQLLDIFLFGMAARDEH